MMLNQHHRYGLKFVFMAFLFLISACGSGQTPEAESHLSENTGADAEVLNETPTQTPTKKAEDKDPKASSTALSEEETGIADLREIVDEIAPLPEKEAEVSESALPESSQAASSELGEKQASSSSDDKTPDASTTGIQETPEFMMALADRGLQTVDVQTGSTVEILFEVDRNIAVSTVSMALGEPTETVDTSECPAGPLKITTWSNGFSLNTLDETFVGWSVRPNPASENLTTIAGVGIGSSRKNLQDAYDVEIFESSLGTEFNVGQMSGILSSDQPDGEITNLWAGLNCIFR